MKAIVCERYGKPLDVLEIKDIDKPIPGEGRVLVRVKASSINKADAAPIEGSIVVRLFGTGWLKPKQPRVGTDLAGVVEAVGPGVTRFKPGDEVFGAADGSYAEYVCAKESLLVLKPANITFEEAASVPIAAISALQGLKFGQLQPGQKVLVYGASGGVGTFAVQIARAYEARVTAVCSPRNVEQTRRLGPEKVIDYTKEDVTRGGQVYDLILAVNGYHPMRDYLRILAPMGRCVYVGGSMRQIVEALALAPLVSKKNGKRIGMMGIAKFNQKDLQTLAELLAAGKLKPVIEQTYPLQETPQAIIYLNKGHVRAKLVIVMN
jgi:NADPH:quinone reductase-like Zn-dependent oxidoreductase